MLRSGMPGEVRPRRGGVGRALAWLRRRNPGRDWFPAPLVVAVVVAAVGHVMIAVRRAISRFLRCSVMVATQETGCFNLLARSR